MKKVAVIVGTYNSGSSALAELVVNLGFTVPPPDFQGHHEPAGMRTLLVNRWPEPSLLERMGGHDTAAQVKAWVETCKRNYGDIVLKHPLIPLMGREMMDACFGPSRKYLVISRRPKYSDAGLAKRKWFQDSDEMQKKLRRAIRDAFFKQVLEESEVYTLSYEEMCNAPSLIAAEVADFLEVKRNPKAGWHIRPWAAPK